MLRHAEEVSGKVAATCRYYGISRKVFYRWKRRYEDEGLEGLKDRSSRPVTSPTVGPAPARPAAPGLSGRRTRPRLVTAPRKSIWRTGPARRATTATAARAKKPSVGRFRCPIGTYPGRGPPPSSPAIVHDPGIGCAKPPSAGDCHS